MRNGIEGVAFDLDGTLYPNYRLNIRLLPFVFREWRLLAAFGKARHIIRKKQAKNILPKSDFYEYQAEITANLLSVETAPLKQKIDKNIYKELEPYFKKVKLFKNTQETISDLRNAGYKLGLLSDFPPETKLEYLGLSGGWDAILCSERCGALKPHEQSFNELAKAMGLPCEKILYVGNSHSYDVIGASKAGMKTAWIKSPFALCSGLKRPKADFSFNNYRQLRKFMID